MFMHSLRGRETEYFLQAMAPFLGSPIVCFFLGVSSGLLGGFVYVWLAYSRAMFWALIGLAGFVMLMLKAFYTLGLRVKHALRFEVTSINDYENTAFFNQETGHYELPYARIPEYGEPDRLVARAA